MRAGDVFEAVVVEDLTRTQIVQYAGASGDFNPIHTDERYVREVGGYPTVFAHGMLTMGMTGRVLTDRFGVENLRRFSARFKAQVWPGDTLTVRAEVVKVADGNAEFSLHTTNQVGVEVISATATVALHG